MSRPQVIVEEENILFQNTGLIREYCIIYSVTYNLVKIDFS